MLAGRVAVGHAGDEIGHHAGTGTVAVAGLGTGCEGRLHLRGLGQATGNVLFNGERPSNKADDMYTQLSRIPAENVERIEIVDGATLDIPGLSGQVANIVYRADSFSGQFSWKPQFRAHYTDPLFTRGDVSVRGRAGQVE